jgi:RNA exonuclease 4
LQLVTIPKEMQIKSDSQKKRRRQQTKRNSDAGSVSSSDDGSTSTSPKPKRKQNRRRNQPKKKKGGVQKAQAPLVELSQEEKNQYIAIDCEMVGTGYAGQHSSLARVCMVDWDGNTLLDLYVRQTYEVSDYRTFVSGITADDLISDDAVDYDECRDRVQELIGDKILVGHALKNDLTALKIAHPWQQVRDTGKYEPFMKIRFENGILWPRKLKDLAKEKLGKDIQESGKPHCPFEDAQTALDLYKKARNKWEKAMDYKINKTREIQNMQQEGVAAPQ